jgi:lysophospholipid acyltransferase (LPLAT)-like uncharacterized protein
MGALAWLLRLHGLTLRFVLDDKAGYFDGRIDSPVIFLLWHNRISSMPAFYERWRRRDRPHAVVLASASREGSLLTEFLRHFGFEAVRGSTSRRASVALREMARKIEQGHDIIITPDGPRGPRYRLQPGALYLAQSTGRPIIPVNVEYARYFRFKSWDGFAIPFFFSRVNVRHGDPWWIHGSCDNDKLENHRRALEQIMIDSMTMDRPNVSESGSDPACIKAT